MRITGLLQAALLAAGLLAVAACSAHNDSGSAATSAVASADTAASGASAAVASAATGASQFTLGDQYVAIKQPPGQAAPTGPVEVVEVFSYGCPHCAEFAPYMDKLRAQLPAGVEVHYMPAAFNPSWVPYAQAYYAAQQLGVFKQTHDALFQAMLQRYPLNSLDDLADFYARHGVDRAKFLAAATNAETTRDMAADRRSEFTWGIDATPTLVVGRRASTARDAAFVALFRNADVSTYEELQQVGLWMVHQVDKH